MPKGYDSNGNKMSKAGTRKLTLRTKSSNFDTSLLAGAEVQEVLAFVLQEGGALRFGLTQDGGALALGIYGLGDPQTKYVRSADELTELLQAIYLSFKEGVE